MSFPGFYAELHKLINIASLVLSSIEGSHTPDVSRRKSLTATGSKAGTPVPRCWLRAGLPSEGGAIFARNLLSSI